MLRMSIRVTFLMALLAAPLAAQGTRTDVPPEPRADSPRTFAERASPSTFGATILPSGDGHLRVSAVAQGSSAAKAGLRSGDHILSVDGQMLTELETFNSYVAARPTSPMSIVVLRDGKQETIIFSPADATTTTHDSHARPALGLRFWQSPQVVIAETVPGSPAEAAGLQAGDRIITFNDEVLTSSDLFVTLVAAAPFDEPLRLGYLRRNERDTVSISPAAWDSVYASTGTYTTLKPVAPQMTGSPVIAYPAYAYPSYNPYYISNVSPVLVPITWYGSYPYGYPYWNYYPGYYSYGYVPYGYYGGLYPGPVHHAKPASELDSTGRPLPGNDRTVGRIMESPDA